MAKKKTLSQFIAEAKSIHGNKFDYSQVLYNGYHTSITIICPLHGELSMTPKKHIYHSQGCKYYPCSAGKKSEWRDKLGFKLYRKRLKEIFGNDIRCIETKPNISKEFLFQCNNCDETWRNDPSYQITTPKRKKRPPSCQKCGGSKATTIANKRLFLKELNIEALGGISSIKNQRTKFQYKCKNVKCNSCGEKTLNQLLQLKKNNLGYCDCTYKRIKWTQQKLRRAGETNGYYLQSRPKKVDTSSVYKWKCASKGHITYFSINSLKNGCKTCFEEKRFRKLSDISSWLKLNAPTIELLPNQTWEGANRDYQFECKTCGSEFSKHIHNLVKIPKCKNQSRSYSELVVQFYLEQILNISFICNRKYDFLRNSNGNKMELDGFNKEHKIAFEHHGIQHYKESRWYNGKNMVKRRSDDSLKRRQCEMAKIKLIEIPALFEITPINNLKNVIKQELERLKIEVPKNFNQINPNVSEMNVYHKKK